MRFVLRTLPPTTLVALALFVYVGDVQADIDAVRGRQYQITKRHGPWMIMVATFHAPPKDLRSSGMTPAEAADELVYELRKKGIPAYPFQLEDRTIAARAFDRSGQQRTSATRYYGGIAVLAGNYPSPKDDVAQATLEYIKQFRPKFLDDIDGRSEVRDDTVLFRLRNGGIFRSTPGRPHPFSGAHLTPNPLLSPEELRARRKDPLLVKLNAGNEYSLLNNTGKYTLVVKTFYGKSVTAVDGQSFERKANSFTLSDSLDRAAHNAWELAVAMRKYKNMQAWVFHDHHRSFVTVGSFDSRKDPRIRRLIELFRSKRRIDNTGNRVWVGEGMTIPLKLKPGQKPLRQWVFDFKPRLMVVPKFGS